MTGILSALAVFFTVLVGRVDVKAIGPEGTKVGFAGINSFFVKAIGVHKIFYTISEVLGYLALIRGKQSSRVVRVIDRAGEVVAL